MAKQKTQRQLAQEAFLQRMALQEASREQTLASEATEAFFAALGITAAQANVVVSFDKKHVLDKLLPMWVQMYAREAKAAQNIAEQRRQVSADIDDILKNVSEQLIKSNRDLREAYDRARDEAYQIGWGRGFKFRLDEEGYAQLGIDTNARPTHEERKAAFPDGVAGRIG